MAKLSELINSAAEKNGIDPGVLSALIMSESNGINYPPRRVVIGGRAHTVTGPGQILDTKAEQLGIDATDPEQNVDGAARLFKKLLDQNGGDTLADVSDYKGMIDPTTPKNQKMIDRFKSFLDGAGKSFIDAQRAGAADAESKGFGRSETGKILGPGQSTDGKTSIWARLKTPEFLSVLFLVLLLTTFSIFNLTKTELL